MAANKVIRFGPVSLTTTTTTNIINTAITSLAGPVGYTQTQPYVILRRIRVTNRTNVAANFALWCGATGANAAGTEKIAAGVATAGALNAGTGIAVPANGAFDWAGQERLDAADFLVGGASAASTLTFEAEGEIGLA